MIELAAEHEAWRRRWHRATRTTWPCGWRLCDWRTGLLSDMH